MIAMHDYTPEEIDYIYSAVEEAAQSGKPIDEFRMNRISGFIHTGDFYMHGAAANGLLFSFNGLKWTEDGKSYSCLIQPSICHEHILPVWKPVITYEDREHSSSGRLSMLRKENRYIDTVRGWMPRALKDT